VYDLPPQFERAKAVRAPCGYVGLRNLSNTCYLNSLFTQLFMNTEFRKFMLNTRIRDGDDTQSLLFQTQSLFGHLQESMRRFVDPTDCVAAIRTYEDAQIDIHNQMDVDEFYNLLFDRWESQLSSSDAKATFRSFYGGQLVQQVTSRECDHVSERLEPFSAIQCDIKGKSSLEESLQAYVGGEIMEGDNKYKCSTCDRHVDAVKRACLKDIPDNLIFHLKRFDFNLRTLQRAKINDHFAFPNRIDMHPFTIAHLSDPLEQAAEQDMFELVGVLVHSGTAESGHYYSYIRERPTRHSSEVWVEFNDDAVSYWDPANLEASCFGGPDYRPPFESNGIVYDKNYSAYMLFYQRSSTLRDGNVATEGSAPPCSPVDELAPNLAEHIRKENLLMLRRHCIFDSAHIELVAGALTGAKGLTGGGRCSASHRLESLAMKVALNHLDQVFSRAKDMPDFDRMYGYIDTLTQSCVQCSYALYDYFDQRHQPMRMLVQKNAEPVVRQDIVDLIIRVLKTLKEGRPEQYSLSAEHDDFDPFIIGGAIRMFSSLFDYFHTNLRSWPEVFGFMLSFVRLGQDETLAFLEREFLRFLLLIVAADPNLDLPAQFMRMIQGVQRRMATRMPSYESILALIAFLLSKMRPQARERVDPEFIERGDDRRHYQVGGFLPTEPEQRILYMDWVKGGSSIFMEKLISLEQNHEATARILVLLMQLTRGLEVKLLFTLRHHISGQITGEAQAPYLTAAKLFCSYASRPQLIETVIRHVCAQCSAMQTAEGKAFLSFFQAVFDAPREQSGETALEVQLQGIHYLPDWAPSLLGYYEDGVGTMTEAFLTEKLFKYGVSPVLQDVADDNDDDHNDDDDDVDDDDDDNVVERRHKPSSDKNIQISVDTSMAAQRSRAIDQAARHIGLNCLIYLRDNYVGRRANIGSRLVGPLQRVIICCQKYFELDDEDVQVQAEKFHALKQGTNCPRTESPTSP
jgi:ubiquitin carboxyl-terminal hydrolase 34